MPQLDCLLVTAPSRKDAYQGLASEFAAVENPIWSGLIARYLSERGYSVGILDAEANGLTTDQAAHAIKSLDPKLIAFSIYGQQPSASSQCLMAAQDVSARLWEMDTVAFGTHPSALPDRMILEHNFYYIVQGEGPREIEEILQRDLKIISWVGPKSLIQNLDVELSTQAFDLMPMRKYRAHNWHALGDLESRDRYASIYTSLGCSFSCSFCCIQTPFGKPGMRWWSAKAIMAQIDTLVERYGVKHLKIADEMFLLNMKHVNAICDGLIERNYGLNIWAYARVDTLKDDATLAKMKRAGFNWLAVGIESGSKHVRDGVEKGRFGDDDIRRAIGRVQDHGIHVIGNYIFGLPDDTEDTMKQTLGLAQELNCEWANFYSAMAYPGSALYREAKQKGWELPEDSVGWIGYAQHSYECLPLRTETLTSAQVLKFRDQAFQTYFTNPDYLLSIKLKFGEKAVEHIKRMVQQPMPRKLYGS